MFLADYREVFIVITWPSLAVFIKSLPVVSHCFTDFVLVTKCALFSHSDFILVTHYLPHCALLFNLCCKQRRSGAVGDENVKDNMAEEPGVSDVTEMSAICRGGNGDTERTPRGHYGGH